MAILVHSWSYWIDVPQYSSVCGCANGSPYTSLILTTNILAPFALAKPTLV